RSAAQTASSSERRDTVALLRDLVTTRVDRAEQLNQLAGAIFPTSPKNWPSSEPGSNHGSP
ncbi:MAG: hypothetical protein ACRDRH_29630, partial [Pseudonocardia sp.]